MIPPANKVDMAQMNAAIDTVLALPPATQEEVKEQRTPRKAERPPPAMSPKNAKQSSCR